MLSVDFDKIETDMKTIGIDVYSVPYGKVPWPPERAQPLFDAIIRERYIAAGMTGEQLERFCKQPTTWARMNTGKIFNFWHFCYRLMDPTMVTTEDYHIGKCVIKRNMVDPEENEDDVKLLLMPAVVTAGRYSFPVINQVLDFYKVDELEITCQVDR